MLSFNYFDILAYEHHPHKKAGAHIGSSFSLFNKPHEHSDEYDLDKTQKASSAQPH